jgi:site-specific DNA recombinase
MKLIGYCRVSTDNQREEGTIEIQRHALTAYAAEQDHDLIEIFSDNGISGALDNRPGLSVMFDCLEVQPEIEGILIFKLDRLARDLYIQEHLLKKLQDMGKKLISIKEPDVCSNDPMRKAFRQFMGIVSELEKAFITMRLSGGRINKARKAGYAGGSPAYGYKAKDKALTIDLEAAETIKAIFGMRQDACSLREIATHLNQKGIPTKKGRRWYAGTVKYILDNPIYQGVVEYADVRAARADLALV